MLDPGRVVRSFFERMDDRDWDGAGRLLSPNLTIDFTETGERFEGTSFLAMNRAYPEGWSIEVVDVLSAEGRVAAQVRVTQADTVFWCAGFYRVADGRIQAGTEHWVTERSQPPPEWRRPFTA